MNDRTDRNLRADDLGGRVAVVTGAASGIGLALARRFAAEGMKLALADIDVAALQEAAAPLAAGGTEVLTCAVDVAVAAQVDAFAARTLERFGEVYVVCNNAGVGGAGGPSWEIPQGAWEWVLGVNLFGVVHGVRAFVPVLLARGEGHVVNVASLAGLGVIPFLSPYSAGKHAVLALTEALHQELALAGSGVRAHVVCPGFVRTNIMERRWDGEAPAAEPTEAPPMELFMREGVAGGVDPSVVADGVLDAMRTGRFMVLTDQPAAEQLVESRLGIVRGAEPALPTLG